MTCDTMPTRAEIRVALERLSTSELLMAVGPIVSHSYTEDAHAVMREILAERGVDPEPRPAAACPACGHTLDLEYGELESKTGWRGYLFVGIGYQPTWFTSRTSRTSEVVLRPRFAKAAVRCKHCGLIMFGAGL